MTGIHHVGRPMSLMGQSLPSTCGSSVGRRPLCPQQRPKSCRPRSGAMGQQETSARFLRREGSRLLEKAGVASVATTGC